MPNTKWSGGSSSIRLARWLPTSALAMFAATLAKQQKFIALVSKCANVWNIYRNIYKLTARLSHRCTIIIIIIAIAIAIAIIITINITINKAPMPPATSSTSPAESNCFSFSFYSLLPPQVLATFFVYFFLVVSLDLPVQSDFTAMKSKERERERESRDLTKRLIIDGCKLRRWIGDHQKREREKEKKGGGDNTCCCGCCLFLFLKKQAAPSAQYQYQWHSTKEAVHYSGDNSLPSEEQQN